MHGEDSLGSGGLLGLKAYGRLGVLATHDMLASGNARAQPGQVLHRFMTNDFTRGHGRSRFD
jgi:hypothetical protein